MGNFIKKNKRLVGIFVGILVLIAFAFSLKQGSIGNNVSHESPLNPAMSNFFKQYDIYYTGWDNYLRNGENLGLTEMGSSSTQAFELAFSENATSSATKTEIARKMKEGQTEGRVLTIFPNSSYVIEDHSPNEGNGAFGGSWSGTLLRFNGDTYTRDAVYSDYFIDQNNIVYIGCLEQAFNESTNGNLCTQYGLYVDHNLVDQTSKSSRNNLIDLTTYLIHNHSIYYSKTDNSSVGYFSYNLSTNTKTALSAADGYDCQIVGFVKNKPVNVCDDYQTYPPSKTDISIGGVPTYHMTYISSADVSATRKVVVVNDHIYYVVTTKPDRGSSQPVKVSLIKDGLKIAEAEEDSSQYFSGAVSPSDGSQTGCLFDNDFPTPAFCIMGDNVISRSNFGFDQNEYYLNGQTIDFTPYYNVILNTSDPKWDFKKPSIWQLAVLSDGTGQVSKVLIKTLEPSNIYVSDLLSKTTISKPELLISNVGGIVGASLK